MPVNPTDDEIDTEIDEIEQRLHDEFLVPPEIYARLETLVKSKARGAVIAVQEVRNEIHEKYHELNDRDIEIQAHAEGYKQGQIDAVKHLFENKIAIVRAVKVLSEDMQDVAKKAGYKPDDVLFITMEKIEGGMVIKGSVAKCESDELVIKKVD